MVWSGLVGLNALSVLVGDSRAADSCHSQTQPFQTYWWARSAIEWLVGWLYLTKPISCGQI